MGPKLLAQEALRAIEQLQLLLLLHSSIAVHLATHIFEMQECSDSSAGHHPHSGDRAPSADRQRNRRHMRGRSARADQMHDLYMLHYS